MRNGIYSNKHPISHKFRNITKDLDAHLSYYSINKFKYILTDILPHLSQRNVYKISYIKDCNATYVGQICRELKTRT